MGKRQGKCFCINLRRASKNITDVYDDELKDLGITVNQYSLLSKLAKAEDVNTADLAKLVKLERTTMTRNLRPLYKAGYIIDNIKEGDRVHKFNISDSGRKLLKKAKPRWEKVQERVYDLFTEEEKENILEYLDRLENM